MILEVLADPFTRPLSERPNERKRALWQNPDVRFAGWAVHCLPSVFAFIILLRESGSKVPEDIPKDRPAGHHRLAVAPSGLAVFTPPVTTSGLSRHSDCSSSNFSQEISGAASRCIN